MAETIYNLFAYSDGKNITHLGIESYNIVDDGTDEEMFEFLRERCLIDHATAYKAKIVSPELSLGAYLSKHRLGTALDIFEELFVLKKAPMNPLFVLTIIEGGVARIDYSYTGDLDLNELKNNEFMEDYLTKYTAADGINLMQMFDDDYFKAIRLLFNNGLLVSSTKLLMIFIDTAAYVEFGDRQGNFNLWLDTFAPLSDIDLAANEIWELRNGVLHMSNLHSRAVLNRKVMRLLPCINLGTTIIDNINNEKRFDMLQLIDVIARGVGAWMESYNKNPEKIEKFVERYDTVISDARSTYRW